MRVLRHCAISVTLGQKKYILFCERSVFSVCTVLPFLLHYYVPINRGHLLLDYSAMRTVYVYLCDGVCMCFTRAAGGSIDIQIICNHL